MPEQTTNPGQGNNKSNNSQKAGTGNQKSVSSDSPFTEMIDPKTGQSVQASNPFKKEDKPKKKFSIWAIFITIVISLVALITLAVFVMSVGGAENPILKTFNIDPYLLKESLLNIANVSFGALTAVLFLSAVVTVFLALITKKELVTRRNFFFVFASISFGMIFLTVLVWVGVINFINRFVANPEPPAARIEYLESDKDILAMEPPIEITFSADQAKLAWERKGKTVIGYNWDFNNDGRFEFNTNETRFVHEFDKGGDVVVSLEVILADGSQKPEDVVSTTIKLPEIGFDISPRKGEAPLEVSFDASKFIDPRDPTVEYTWNFNDGTNEFITDKALTTYTFDKIGTYNVTLRTRTSAGNIEYFTGKVEVFGSTYVPVLDAVIKVEPGESGEAPFSIRVFGDESISSNGEITDYEWNFGDKTLTEKGKVIDHIYTEPGEYNLTLTIKNAEGEEDIQAQTITVQKQKLAPTAVIKTTPESTVGVIPFEVVFDATSSFDPDDNISQYEWDIDGDGTADSFGATLTHTFWNEGENKVYLTVRDLDGQESKASVIVTAEGKGLQAVITANPVSGPVPLRVDFDASQSFYTKGKIVSYKWDFADGTEPELAGAQKSHVFEKVGQYDVKLEVFADDNKTAETNITIYARVIPTQACYTVSRHDGDAPLSVIFNSACSTGNIVSWKWDFGDSSISRDRRPEHVFDNPGVYTVKLEILDSSNNVSTYTDTISVTKATQ